MKKDEEEFFLDLEKFKKQRDVSNNIFIPKIEIGKNKTIDKTHIKLDWIYTNQNNLAFKTLIDFLKKNPCQEEIKLDQRDINRYRALDVGSQWSAVTLFSAACPYVYVEPNINLSSEKRSIDSGVPMQVCSYLDLMIVQTEAQHLPFPSGHFKFISSLHAVEHFGLGRYKDEIDYNGDMKGLLEFNRVLNKDGIFVVSVPVVAKERERIVFNDNRLYHPLTFIKMLEQCGFIVVDYVFLLPNDCIAHGKPLNILDSVDLLEKINYNHDYGLICICKKSIKSLKF